MATTDHRANALEAVLDFGQLSTVVPASMFSLAPEEAPIALAALMESPQFCAAALERSTPAAQVRTLLAARAAGKSLTREQVAHLASGKTFGYGESFEGAMPASAADPLTMNNISQRDAATKLTELQKDPAWAAAALERGTPQAVERLMLNAQAAGATMTATDAARHASAVIEG